VRPRLPRGFEPPALIQHGGITQKLIGLLGIKGKVSTPVLGDTLHPVAIVEDMSARNWFTGGDDRPAAAAAKVVGDATHIPIMVLLNPAGSQTAMLIEKVSIATGANVDVWLHYFPGVTPGGITQGYRFRDTRLAGLPVGQIFLSTVDYVSNAALIAAGAIPLMVGNGNVSGNLTMDVGVILGAGAQLLLTADSVASTGKFTYLWRERPIVTQGGSATS